MGIDYLLAEIAEQISEARKLNVGFQSGTESPLAIARELRSVSSKIEQIVFECYAFLGCEE